jgi:hypothetical protein
MLSFDEICLYSGCELSTSVLKRSMEYVLDSVSSSCSGATDEECVAMEVLPMDPVEVTCDSMLSLN